MKKNLFFLAFLFWSIHLVSQNIGSCASNYEPNNTLAEAVPINVNKEYYAGIGSSRDEDFYKFTLNDVSDIEVLLWNLPHDYDLRLYNSLGQVIGISGEVGVRSEYISKNKVAPGDYYVQVYGYGGYDLNRCYTLKVNAKILPCFPPIGLCAQDITDRGVTFDWALIEGAKNYTIEYKEANAVNWIIAGNTSSYFYKLSGLKPNTVYNWRMKASCSSTNSSNYVSGGNFKTKTIATLLEVFPNPVSNILYIRGVDLIQNNSVQVVILNQSGKPVKSEIKNVENVIMVNVSDLYPGIYYLNILDTNFKFIKN